MDGFTGLNPEEITIQVRDLYDKSKEISQGFETAINQFRLGLKANWASPNAVEFGQKTYSKFYSLISNVVGVYGQLLENVGSAVRKMAQANGLTLDLSEYTSAWSRLPAGGTRSWGLTLSPSSYDQYNAQDAQGRVGMNVNEVKNLLQEFSSEMNKYKQEITNYNPNISLFDPDGSMQSLYKWQQEGMAKRISEYVDEINGLVQESINTETDTILQGIVSATDSMSQNSVLDISANF